MGQGLVNITENPCKMCFPLGVVTAVYGVAGAMNLLHGSQGCSTYIRRHMATHYNEPVDIASTSLSEEGTVFGGEKNLLKGLTNLIRLYDPKLIAVSTTCLAETIGENLAGSLRRFKEENHDIRAELISVNAPGYGGTHFEGYWRGLRAVISGLTPDLRPHGGLNVIVGPASPADVRHLKDILSQSGLPFTLFPDISDNLDGSWGQVYNRLPRGGTEIFEIAKMAGAALTLELSTLGPESESPGLYLEKTHAVKCLRLTPPVGLTATDAFIKALTDLGANFPKRLSEERGRLMDAMADSHKYSAMGRSAIFGDPDFVLSIAGLCAENGLSVKLAATGSRSAGFKETLDQLLGPVNLMAGAGEVITVDSADFALIGRQCRRLGVNLLIGSSEGRRLAQEEGLPLVRATFPVHDHVGGQRIRTMGYQGATTILDQMVNKLISREEERFRIDLKNEHHRPTTSPDFGWLKTSYGSKSPPKPSSEPGSHVPNAGVSQVAFPNKRSNTSPTARQFDLAPWGLPEGDLRIVMDRTDTHPCFSLAASHGHARLHLPVSPGCNISCNYCRRDMDCPNESRPGVTSVVLNPEEALERFRETKRRLPHLSVVGFAGPGEALHSPEALFKTMDLVRREDDRITLCLSTNGLMLPFHLATLHELGLRHLTVTVNAIDEAIGAKIYAWADYFGQRHQSLAAAGLMIENQLSGIRAAKAMNMTVKVNTVLIKDINDKHIIDIARKLSKSGVDLANIMPHIPVAGSAFENFERPSQTLIRDLRFAAGAHVPQMTHCRQCRADAIGLLGQDIDLRDPIVSIPISASLKRPGYKIAVVTKSGVMVDSHFGQAERVHIYFSDGESLKLLENRKIDGLGQGCGGSCGFRDLKNRTEKPKGFIQKIISKLDDVDAVVALRIGDSPREILEEKGIKSFATMDSIENSVLAAAKKLKNESNSDITAKVARDVA